MQKDFDRIKTDLVREKHKQLSTLRKPNCVTLSLSLSFCSGVFSELRKLQPQATGFLMKLLQLPRTPHVFLIIKDNYYSPTSTFSPSVPSYTDFKRFCYFPWPINLGSDQSNLSIWARIRSWNRPARIVCSSRSSSSPCFPNE